MPPAHLTFGILCDGATLERWQARCVDELLALGSVRATCLVNIKPTHAPADAPRAAAALFELLLNRPADDSPARRTPLDAALAALPRLDISADHDAGSLAAPERAALGALDFMLCFSDSPFAHTLSGLPRLGVWAYRFTTDEHRWLHPPGFWEVHERRAISGALLVRLTRDPRRLVPLRRGSVPTRAYSYAANRDQLLARFAHWPAQLCREVLHAAGSAAATAESSGEFDAFTAPAIAAAARPGALPGPLTVLAHPARLLWHALTVGLRPFVRFESWNIGIVQQPIAEFIDPARPRRPIQWLPARPRGQFVADPFGWRHEGQLTIFCETLDYRDGIGRIAALSGAGFTRTSAVDIGPQPAVHLSYPYLVEFEGRLRCIPESQAAGEVALYTLERFPDRWVRTHTLVTGPSLVDATLFEYSGRWWLAGASDPGATRLGAELHLWHAATPVGPWTAHIGNPVKIDIRSARPAGTPFVVGGVLYRPAQDSSTTYGSRVVINRVRTLTPSAFYEEPAAFVEPDPRGPYPDGLHTLSSIGDLTLVDGKRSVFSGAELRRMLTRMLRRRIRAR